MSWTVAKMTSAPFVPLMTLVLVLVLVLTFGLVTALPDEFDVEYSNEYDDVRPHLIYPDEPRLDKRISEAAREFGQNITQAWQSMVDSFKTYFEELGQLFNPSAPPDPNAVNEVFSAH